MSPVPALSSSADASALGRVLTCLAVLTALASFGASSAAAQEKEDSRISLPGTIGAAYVVAFDNFDHLQGQEGDPGEGHGGTVFMTYRFNQWIASVVRGELIDGFEIGFGGDDVKTLLAQGRLGARIYPAAALTGVIDHRVEPYLEAVGGFGFGERNLGVGFDVDVPGLALNLDQREYGFVARFAAGAEVWVTEQIGLDVSALYNQPTGELVDWAYYGVSAGLIYRF